MNLALTDYVLKHTVRGECQCGRCIDAGTAADPTGHTVDMVFFKIAAVAEPQADEFVRLTTAHEGAYGPCNPLDGQEHGYMELGGWIGDQGLAMQYMALGTLLGVFDLLSPHTMGMPKEMHMRLAMSGYITIRKKVVA